MTQNPFEKLLLLAVASGMSVAEFRSAINAVHAVGPSDLEGLFKQVRNRMRHLDAVLGDGGRSEAPSPIRDDVLTLVRSAALPPRLAADRIASQLMAEYPAQPLPPFNQKEGLARWIERVSMAVGESALLNAAVAALAPENRHGRSWTLGRS
jgi:hypothetical protein